MSCPNCGYSAIEIVEIDCEVKMGFCAQEQMVIFGFQRLYDEDDFDEGEHPGAQAMLNSGSLEGVQMIRRDKIHAIMEVLQGVIDDE